jgi:hypothetical protein
MIAVVLIFVERLVVKIVAVKVVKVVAVELAIV